MKSQSSIPRRRGGAAAFTAAIFLLLAAGACTADRAPAELTPPASPTRTHRKLLHGPETVLNGNGTAHVEPNRVWTDKCSKSDIVVSQGPTRALPSGIPTYTVVIVNACVSGCDISAIHLTCGWFSSARLINPRVFKRLRFDDCLVNNGTPLAYGRTLSFQYANTYPYPLSVSSVKC